MKLLKNRTNINIYLQIKGYTCTVWNITFNQLCLMVFFLSNTRLFLKVILFQSKFYLIEVTNIPYSIK